MTRLIIIRSIILVLIVVAGWFLLIAPRIGEPSRLAEEAAAAQAQATLLNTQAANPAAIEEQFLQAVDVAAKMNVRYPEAVEVSGLTTSIAEAAKNAGIAPDSIPPVTPSEPVVTGAAAPATPADAAAPAPAADGAAPDAPAAAPAAPNVESATVTFDITVTGNLAQLTTFIQTLPLQQRGIFVNTVALAPAGDRAGFYTATLSCTSLLIKATPIPANNVAEATAEVAEQADVTGNLP